MIQQVKIPLPWRITNHMRKFWRNWFALFVLFAAAAWGIAFIELQMMEICR